MAKEARAACSQLQRASENRGYSPHGHTADANRGRVSENPLDNVAHVKPLHKAARSALTMIRPAANPWVEVLQSHSRFFFSTATPAESRPKSHCVKDISDLVVLPVRLWSWLKLGLHGSRRSQFRAQLGESRRVARSA